MTNTEHANKWYEIIASLTDITKSATNLETWFTASHYLIFATEMWMMYIAKDLREN